MALIVGALALGLASVLLLHEAGHAFAAVVCGGRIEQVVWRGLGARVVATLPSRRAQLAFLLAGSLANVAAGLGLGALAFAAGSSTMATVMGLIAGMHLLHAAFALVPSGTTDGARLRALLRERGQCDATDTSDRGDG
ncbi:MAG: hypothetical protein HYS27_05955 [Deltaproteobacteria bacterium]|nr:hypothetical protein [Deltaproteobacteria bacterium]